MGHLDGKKFLEASFAVLGTNSFGVKPETKPTVELVVTASGPQMEETTSATPDRSQPKHFATTGETYDNPPLDLEADDKGTSVPGSESHRDLATHVSQELPQCASSSQLPRFRIYGGRESCNENRKKCQNHVLSCMKKGIGAHAVLVSTLKCQKSESRSEHDSRLLRASEDQGVERSFDMSGRKWRRSW